MVNDNDKEFLDRIAEKYSKSTKMVQNEFWRCYQEKKITVDADVYDLLSDVLSWENKKKGEMIMKEEPRDVDVRTEDDLVDGKKKDSLFLKQEMPKSEWIDTVRHLFQSGMFTDLRSLSQAITKAQCGRELGFPPYYSLQNFFILPGKPPASTGQVMAALLKRSGFNYRVVKLDDTICVIKFFGLKGEDIGDASFGYDEACKIIINTKYGKKRLSEKDNWKNYRQDMLFWRAMARGARRHCPDVIAGLYLQDEIYVDEDSKDNNVNEKSDLSEFRVEPVVEPVQNENKFVKSREEIIKDLVDRYGKKKVVEVKNHCNIKESLLAISDEDFEKICNMFVEAEKIEEKIDAELAKDEMKKEEKVEMTKEEKYGELKKIVEEFGKQKVAEVKEKLKIECSILDLNENGFKKFVKKVRAKK